MSALKTPVVKTSKATPASKKITDVAFFLGTLQSEWKDKKTGEIVTGKPYQGMQISWKENGDVQTWNFGTVKADVLARLIAKEPKLIDQIQKFLDK